MFKAQTPNQETQGAPEVREAPDVHVEVPVEEVGGPAPCLHASLAPLECSLPPAVNTLQTLCLTLSCLSAPHKTLLLPGPSDQLFRFVTAYSTLSFFWFLSFPLLSCKLHSNGMVCIA